MKTKGFGNYYHKAISAKGIFAMKHKQANGETMHLAPLGFKNARQDGRSVTIPDPATWGLIEEALLLRKHGHTLKEICRVMKRKGLRSKRGQVVGIATMDRLLKRDYSSFKS